MKTRRPKTPTGAAQRPTEMRTAGKIAIAWVCEKGKGGCGYQGIVPDPEGVQHWQRGGAIQVTCDCGVRVIVRRPQQPRIVTPAQHAAQTARGR